MWMGSDSQSGVRSPIEGLRGIQEAPKLFLRHKNIVKQIALQGNVFAFVTICCTELELSLTVIAICYLT